MDQLEQYVQKIYDAKTDPLVSQIVDAQKEYVAERINLRDGESIKKLAIKTIRKISELDLERLILESHLVASTYERAREEGLGDDDLTHKLGERYNGNPWICQEATAKILFLAYTTKELGEIQEQFLQDYLSNDSSSSGTIFLNPDDHRQLKYKIKYKPGDEKCGSMCGNMAFVRFNESYKKAHEKARKLREASIEFKGLINKGEDSPIYNHAANLGAFYGTWLNGIARYFPLNKYNKGEIEIPLSDMYVKSYMESPDEECYKKHIIKGLNDDGIVEIECIKRTD